MKNLSNLNTRTLWDKLLIIVLICFSLTGAWVTSNLLHELSHKQDYKEVPKYNDELCVLTWPSGAGYYYLEYDKTNTTIVNGITKYTEWKAYGISVLVYMVWALGLFKLLDMMGLSVFFDKVGERLKNKKRL